MHHSFIHSFINDTHNTKYNQIFFLFPFKTPKCHVLPIRYKLTLRRSEKNSVTSFKDFKD